MTRRANLSRLWEHPDPAPTRSSRPVPYLIDNPSEMASTAAFVRFRDRTLCRSWRRTRTIPICRASCNASKPCLSGGRRSRPRIGFGGRTSLSGSYSAGIATGATCSRRSSPRA